MYKYHLKDIYGNILLTSYIGYSIPSEAVRDGLAKSRSLKKEEGIITTVEIGYYTIGGDLIN